MRASTLRPDMFLILLEIRMLKKINLSGIFGFLSLLLSIALAVGAYIQLRANYVDASVFIGALIFSLVMVVGGLAMIIDNVRHSGKSGADGE